MATKHTDIYGREYYVDARTGERTSRAGAMASEATYVTQEGRLMDSGDEGKRTGTGFFGMDQGGGKWDAGDAESRALVRERSGIEAGQKMEGDEWKDLRKTHAQARRAERRLERIEERDRNKARRKGYKEGQQSTYKSLGGGSTRKQKLEAKKSAIATGAGGKMTSEDYKVQQYFEELNSDREEIAAKKVMEVATVVVTAGALGAFSGGAGAVSGAGGGTTAAAGASGGGATAAAGGSSAAMTTGGATFTGGSTLAAGSVPAGATAATGASGATAAAGSSSAAMVSGGATFTGGSTVAAGSIPAGATSAAGGSALGTTAVAAPASTGALTLGEKIVKGAGEAKEYYDKAKPYIEAAQTVAGAFETGGGGGGQPQGGLTVPAQMPLSGGQIVQASPVTQMQMPTQYQPPQSLSGMSSGMPDQQMQGVASALGAGSEDNYDLSTFVNPSDMQNLYAEKGGRVKTKTEYPEQVLKQGGRIKRA
jgi:hypothetical protein